jgi:hypothetical protein
MSKFNTEYSLEHEGVPTCATTVDVRPGWDVILEYFKPYAGEVTAPPIRLTGYLVAREKMLQGDINVALEKSKYLASLPETAREFVKDLDGGFDGLNEDIQYLMDEYVGILTIKDQVL